MIQKPPIGIKPEFICIRDRINDIQMAMDRYLDAGMTIPYSWTEEYIRLLTEKEKAEKRFEENFRRATDMITKEQAAEWFETMRPLGPAAREMYRVAAEVLRNSEDRIPGRCEDCALCNKEHGIDGGPYEARLFPCKRFSCKDAGMTFFTHQDDFCSGFVPREEDKP